MSSLEGCGVISYLMMGAKTAVAIMCTTQTLSCFRLPVEGTQPSQQLSSGHCSPTKTFMFLFEVITAAIMKSSCTLWLVQIVYNETACFWRSFRRSKSFFFQVLRISCVLQKFKSQPTFLLTSRAPTVLR